MIADALFEFNQAAPSDGINILKRGRIGEAKIKDGVYVVEMRGLAQALQQPVGALSSITCRARLFHGRCRNAGGIGLNADDWRVTGTLTHVASAQAFRCDLPYNGGTQPWVVVISPPGKAFLTTW